MSALLMRVCLPVLFDVPIALAFCVAWRFDLLLATLSFPVNIAFADTVRAAFAFGCAVAFKP